jgi:hypothetical protein
LQLICAIASVGGILYGGTRNEQLKFVWNLDDKDVPKGYHWAAEFLIYMGQWLLQVAQVSIYFVYFVLILCICVY